MNFTFKDVSKKCKASGTILNFDVYSMAIWVVKFPTEGCFKTGKDVLKRKDVLKQVRTF